MATLIGLCIRTKLLRSLPPRFKVDIQVSCASCSCLTPDEPVTCMCSSMPGLASHTPSPFADSHFVLLVFVCGVYAAVAWVPLHRGCS